MNGGMAPVPQLARIFMDMDELSSRGETENKVVVGRMTHADIWALIRFMELFVYEPSLSREHENLTTQGKFPDCHFFVELQFGFQESGVEKLFHLFNDPLLDI